MIQIGFAALRRALERRLRQASAIAGLFIFPMALHAAAAAAPAVPAVHPSQRFRWPEVRQPVTAAMATEKTPRRPRPALAAGTASTAGAADRAAAGAAAALRFVATGVPPDGRSPVDLAFVPSGAEVAIANRDSGNVTFFDTATGTITTTVPVGQDPVSVAATPDGRYVLSADLLDGTLSVIDLSTHTRTAHVALTGQFPFCVEVTADSRYAVVAMSNDGKASSFSVVDLSTLREILSFPSAPQGQIGGVAVPGLGLQVAVFTRFALTPDGSHIVLADFMGGALQIYDRASGAPSGTVVVPSQPWFVDISGDGAFAIVGHEGDSGSLTRVDLRTLAAATFPLPTKPFLQVNRITRDGKFALVGGLDSVAFVDLTSGAVTAVLPARESYDIGLTADGTRALVGGLDLQVLDVASQTSLGTAPINPARALWRCAAGTAAGSLAALESTTGESLYLFDLSQQPAVLSAAAPTGELPEGHAPRSVALRADGQVALVANAVTGNVAVVDVVHGALLSLIPVGQSVSDLALSPDGQTAVAVDLYGGTVAIINVGASGVVASLSFPGNPDRVLISPDGRTAYVLGRGASPALAFVTLAGAASSITATLPIVGRGPMDLGGGSTTAGAALSPDGSILAICGNTANTVQLIDTAARQQIVQVGVGTTPLRAAFSNDGTRLWIADAGSNDVAVLQVSGNTVTLLKIISVAQPLDLYSDPSGAWFYAVSVQAGHPAIYVLDAQALAIGQVVTVPAGASGFQLGPSRWVPAAGWLLVTGTTGNLGGGASGGAGQSALLRLSLNGSSVALIDSTPLAGFGYDLAASADGSAVVVSQVNQDGVDLATFARGPLEPCAANASTLCLGGARFRVTANWRTGGGLLGDGQAQSISADTGWFWFFAPANLEVIVKVLDGCALNGRYWVFAAGLTNTQVSLVFTDTATGETRTYINPQGAAFLPIQDTIAFSSCP